MLSALFVRRPIGTFLLAMGLALAGSAAYRQLPIASLPNVDIPTVVVFAARPGAEPATMATGVAAPLERELGGIAGLNEMMSISASGASTIVLQFSTARDMDSVALDVQAAINAAAGDLPADLPTRPFFRKYNPADIPILTIALTSNARPLTEVHELADAGMSQTLSQVPGVGQVQVNGADVPAIRVQLNPAALARTGLTGRDVENALRAANAIGPVGGFQADDRAETIGINGQLTAAQDYPGLLLRSSRTGVVRLGDVAKVIDGAADIRLGAWSGATPAVLLSVLKSADSNVIETSDRVKAALPALQARLPPDIGTDHPGRPHDIDPRWHRRCKLDAARDVAARAPGRPGVHAADGALDRGGRDRDPRFGGHVRGDVVRWLLAEQLLDHGADGRDRFRGR